MIIAIIILILFLLSVSLIIHNKKEKFTSINGTITVSKTLNIKTGEKQVIDIDVADGIIRLNNYTGALCKDRGLCLKSDLIETMTLKQWEEEQNRLNKKRSEEQKAIQKQQSNDKKILDNIRLRIKQLLEKQATITRKLKTLENKTFANKSISISKKYKQQINNLINQRRDLDNRISKFTSFMNYLQSEKHQLHVNMKNKLDKYKKQWDKDHEHYFKQTLFNEYQKYLETFLNNNNDNAPPFRRYTVTVDINYNVKVNNNATYEEIIDNISQCQYSISCNDMEFFENFDIAVCIGDSCKKYDIGNSVIQKKQYNDNIIVSSIVLTPRNN